MSKLLLIASKVYHFSVHGLSNLVNVFLSLYFWSDLMEIGSQK